MMSLRGALAAIAFALLGLTPLHAASFSADQTKEIQGIVKGYLLDNPEVLRDVIIELDKRDKQADAEKQKKALADLADSNSPLYKSADGLIVGNPAGTITIVEFFDYNCGFCKKSLPDVSQLIQDNKDLRVILRDLPILSRGSQEAAIVASAVHRQLQGDKFWDYHRALLSERNVGKQQALDVAKSMGVDMDRLGKDMVDPAIKDGIDQSVVIAKSLSIDGTPSFVIAGNVLPGAVGYDEMSKTVQNVRKCGKAMCS